eukprot:4255990-Alexandrium_andersonii.AAC.1
MWSRLGTPPEPPRKPENSTSSLSELGSARKPSQNAPPLPRGRGNQPWRRFRGRVLHTLNAGSH